VLRDYEKVLVTGGAGFVGCYIAEELVRLGKQVLVLDDLSTGKGENVPEGAVLLQADVADWPAVRAAMDGIDLVVHAAAQPSARSSVEDPWLDLRSNVWGTYNVLESAREARVKKVVYTSSSAAYGEPKTLPMREEDRPEPGVPYGVSKLCGENYTLVYHRVFDLPCVCLRPFNVYGPRENPETTLDEVFRYTESILKGEEVVVYGDGTQSRDFIHAGDVARAHVLAAEVDAAVGDVFNVGTGRPVTIKELIEQIERVTGSAAKVRWEQWRPGDIYQEYADTRRAQEVLGFSAGTGLERGIRELVSSFKESAGWPSDAEG
jgi:UDP-glucose 4-epimerase